MIVLPASYPTPERPGWGIFVQDHARAAALDHNLVVVASGGPRRSLTSPFPVHEAVEDGIRTIRVSYREAPAIQVRYLLAAINALAHLRRRGFRPDLIHAHFHRAAATATALGALTRVPVVVSEHSSEFPRDALSRGARLRARFAFRAAELVCPVSESLRESIERHGISARFRVVPNTVDTSVFHPNGWATPREPPPRLLTVAQMIPRKGLDYLLQALAMVATTRRDFALDVVGDGPELSAYTRLARELRLGDRVTFHGFKPKRAIAEMMRRASFFVLPSLFENQPVVLIEAMASGLPVLATRVGGAPELVSEDVGLLVPPADAESLRQGIERMLSSFGEYPSEAIAAAAATRFSYQKVGAVWTQVYEEAMSLRRASHLPP